MRSVSWPRGALALCAGLLAVACETAPTGSPCRSASECAGNLVCLDGVCRSECSAHADCRPVGTVCRIDDDGVGSCSIPGMTCDGTCTAGLVCEGATCLQPCASVSDCPPASACRAFGGGTRMVCLPSDSDAAPQIRDAAMSLDSGPRDGGVDDTGPPDANDDKALPDAGPECTDDAACGPPGLVRCDLGRCVPGTAPTVEAPFLVPAPSGLASTGISEQEGLAFVLYRVANEPWSGIVTAEGIDRTVEVRSARLVPAGAGGRVVEYTHLRTRGGESIYGVSVAARRAADDDFCVAVAGRTTSEVGAYSYMHFRDSAWINADTDPSFVGPAWASASATGAPYVGWRSTTPDLVTRALDAPSLFRITDPFAASEIDVRTAALGGPWAVVASGTRLAMMRADDAFFTGTPQTRSDGSGPVDVAWRATTSVSGPWDGVIAYVGAEGIILRQLTCSGAGCVLDLAAPPDRVIDVVGSVPRISIATLPSGGLSVAWVEEDAAGTRVRADLLSFDTLRSWPREPLMLLAGSASERAVALDSDTLGFRYPLTATGSTAATPSVDTDYLGIAVATGAPAPVRLLVVHWPAP